jgi:predicted dehydrogenase
MRAVIIGCGLIARSHVKAIKNNTEAKLVGVCDIDADKAQQLAQESDIPFYTDAIDMLDDLEPDFAVICVPTFLHEHYVRICAERGIHVLCEKPLERNQIKCQALIDTIKRTGIIFMTAQVVRFWPGYDVIKRLADEGQFGDILMIHLRRVSSRDSSYSKWLFDPELGGGAMHDMLVHDVDYLRYLLGPFSYCFANAKQDETGCYNNVFANIFHKNGTHAVAEVSFNMQKGYPFSFSVQIVGTRMTLEYMYAAGATIADRSSTVSKLETWTQEHGKQSLPFDSDLDPYQIQMDYFISCVQKGEQPTIITPDESLEVIRMIDALHESADCNQIIKL